MHHGLLSHDPNAIPVSVFRVESGLLGTMGIPILRGRDLTEKEADGATPDGVVINEYLARRSKSLSDSERYDLNRFFTETRIPQF